MLRTVDLKLFNTLIPMVWDEWEEEYGHDIEILFEIIDEKLGVGSYSYLEIIYGIFYYYVNIINEDPFDEISDTYLGDNFQPEDVYEILHGTGWLDKYYTPKSFIVQRTKSKTLFRDVKIEGDKIFLYLDTWDDLKVLFNYDDQYLVEKVLGMDNADLYGQFDVDFDNDVWDNLDEKSLQHIKEYIKKNYVVPVGYSYNPNQLELFDKPSKKLDVFEIDGRILDTKFFNEIIQDNSYLCELIEDENIFDDLKRELESFYIWAYDSAAESQLFSEAKEKIISILGSDGEWVNSESKVEYELKFDITNIFMDTNINYIKCTGYFTEEKFNYFLNALADNLYCEGELLEISDMNYFYPDSNIVAEHLNENILGNL